MTNQRKFTSAPAVRASIPLWIGLYGTSGAGKTYSALRLARGIHSVVGGKIAIADTESGRGLHYADEFQYHHYPFDPPFDPLSYRAIIEQMAADGVTVAIIDSASHEHEGEGGVLEMHEAEIDRLVANSKKMTRDGAKMLAWNKPKQARRRLINGAQRSPLHLIWCFRAKEKLKIKRGAEPEKLGFMPIAGDELVYEMTLTALLLPGAYGVPTWKSEEMGERQMIKLPHWAKAMLRSGAPLDEQLGAALARWAQGSDAPPARQTANATPIDTLLWGYGSCDSWPRFEELEAERKAAWSKASASDKRALKAAADSARASLEQQATADAEIDQFAARDDDGPPEGLDLPTFVEEQRP